MSLPCVSYAGAVSECSLMVKRRILPIISLMSCLVTLFLTHICADSGSIPGVLFFMVDLSGIHSLLGLHAMMKGWGDRGNQKIMVKLIDVLLENNLTKSE